MAPSTIQSQPFPPRPGPGPVSKRERLGSAVTSLKRLVQDEWERTGSQDTHPLPLPPLRAHSARSSSLNSSNYEDYMHRIVAPPPPAQVPFPLSSHLPSPPESPDLGDTPASSVAVPSDKGKQRQSVEQEQENAEIEAALQASLREEQLLPRQGEDEDIQLREVLQQSRDDELARQQQVDEREQSDLTAALLASSTATDNHAQPTLYRPRSQTLPAFSAADFAASTYLPEKAREFPQGRPALPPGAGSAWDDEQREMELLAEAIRISKEEEEERLRLEAAELEEGLRRSQLAATTSSEESADLPANDLSSGGSATDAQESASASPRSPKGQRHSWLRPPLASKLASSAPYTSPLDGVAPLPPPPRSLPTNRGSSTTTIETFHTAPEASPFSNLDLVSPVPPPRPSRPPPQTPIVPVRGPLARPPPPTRLPPPAPEALSSGSHSQGPATLPSPREEQLVAHRDENNGSPYELPSLTPSTSVRGNGYAARTSSSAPNAGQWDSRSSVSSYDPISTSSYSGELSSRHHSVSTVQGNGVGPQGEDGSRSISSTESSGPPLSPLSVRNPDDGPDRSDSSRTSTLSTMNSTSSASSAAEDEQQVESLWIENLPMFPAGLTGGSAYAGRSMSAIDETTEPASSVHATEQGGIHESAEYDIAGSARTPHGLGFPEEVSLESTGASIRRLPDEPAPIVALDERSWLAGERDRPTRPVPSSSSAQREPPALPTTLPFGTVPKANGARGPQGIETSAAASSAAAATVHDLYEDGLRFGYPAACARDLRHACPADGLSASADVPTRIELSCVQDEVPQAEWAIEAHSWVALVRALMWHGDSTICAARVDLAQSRSHRCAATARLEFRPDDEGVPVLRLVVALVPPREVSTHLAQHRELSVSGRSEQEGKGKARALQPSLLASFALPDLLHLPTRLSSLAIQLYTLRHLAGIARATQPAQQNVGSPVVDETGYTAMRILADSITALARAAQNRERQREDGETSSVQLTPRATSTGPAGALDSNGAATLIAPGPGLLPPRPRSRPPEEQNARLVRRLRDRLRRLKRRGPASGSAAAGVASSGSSAASAEAPERERVREGPPPAKKLVKPMPPARATAVNRSQRVLAAEDSHARDRRAGPSTPLARNRPNTDIPESEVEREMRYLPVL